MNARQKRIKDIEEMAKRAFEHHVIETRLHQGAFRNWMCHTKGTNCYHFTITTIPGRIFVNGDVGDLVLERERDMLPWCRGSIDSIDYFFEKAIGEAKEYDPDLAKEWVKEELLEAARNDRTPEQIVELEELYEEDDYMDEYAFKSRLINEELCDPAEPPECRNFTYSALWCREAIKWLLAHIPTAVKLPDMYRYKRNIISAVRWTPEKKLVHQGEDFPQWVTDGLADSSLFRFNDDIFVGEPNEPLADRMIAHPGDWIIRSANGTLGSVPNAMFLHDYEPVTSEQEVPCTSDSLIELAK